MIILLGIVLLSCKNKEHKTIITSKFSEKSNLLIKKDTTEKELKIKTLKSKNDFKKLHSTFFQLKKHSSSNVRKRRSSNVRKRRSSNVRKRHMRNMHGR